MRTSNYSDYLSSSSALIGVDQGDLQTTETNFLNVFFNRSARKIWESNTWIDLCPVGEVRFPVNIVQDPNLTQTPGTGYSTLTGVTCQTLNYPNPLDNRTTGAFIADLHQTSAHNIQYTLNNTIGNGVFVPNQPYCITGYARPIGLGGASAWWVYVNWSDGGGTYGAYFNLTGTNPVVGTVTSTTSTLPTSSVSASGNGYFKWSCTWTATPTANSGSITVGFSLDGVQTSYLGVGTSMVFWGTTCFLSQSYVPASYYIPWAQLGEQAIDAVLNVWSNDPGGTFLQRNVPYNITPNGVELIGPSGSGYYYLYYRPQRPLFTGAAWSSSSTYSVGQTIQFTSAGALTSGQTNYYTCTASTTAGQSPDTTAASWSMTTIPYVFLEYIIYNSYADWLQTEGQTGKAQAMYQYAQSCMDDENDRQERQMGVVQPWRVSTHVTSQNRGMGYQGQNFNPAGTAILTS